MNISSLVTDSASFHPRYKAVVCGDDGREFT